MEAKTNSTPQERELFKIFLKSLEYGAKRWIQFVNIHHKSHPNESIDNFLEQHSANCFICDLIPFSQAQEWELIQNEWRNYLSQWKSNTQNK